MNRRKILAITGARSEYDLLFEIYKKLDTDKRFDFSLVITGPHLSERYGFTAKQIEKDGFKIEDRIFNLIDSNEKIGRIVSIGNQIPVIAQTLYRVKPDIVLVAGDREEAISTAMACAFLDIPVAHFFGGDIAKDGNIDNSIRYATSKFAHIHFPSLTIHKENLLRLGEDDWRIFVVGNPALDRFLTTPDISNKELASRLGLNEIPSRYFLLIQHSIITEFDQQKEHIEITLNSLLQAGIFCFINYPNSDAGNAAIISAYQEYEKLYPNQFKLFQNLDRETYINLLRKASCLLGNSSSGILEAPTLGLPAINIGCRQRGRLHGDNVIFVDNNENDILQAISIVLTDESFKKRVSKKYNPYGDGNSSEKVVEILAQLNIDKKLIHKNITY